MQLSAQTAGKREREENQNGSTLTKKSVLVPCGRTPSRLCRYTRVARTASTATLRTCIFCNFSSYSYSRSLLLSLSLLSSSSFCPRLSCPRRSPRSFFSHLSRECFVSNALRLSTTKTTSFLHSLEPVCFLLLSLSSSSSSLSLLSFVQILYCVVCSSSPSFHYYVYIIYLCLLLLMLFLWIVESFLCKMKFYAFFQN